MTVNITVVDEQLSGDILNQFTVTVQSNRVTVREIIQSRVTQEVEAYNNTPRGQFHGLVQPTESEQILNGYRLKPRRQINREQQVQAALDAFTRNAYLVLINSRQAESLDDEVVVTPDTKVSFVKLVPLCGG